jgi:hypothetical protein
MDDIPADLAPEYMIETVDRMMQAQKRSNQSLKRDIEVMKKRLAAFYQPESYLFYRVINVALLCGAALNLWVAVGVLITQNTFFNSRFQAFIAFLYLIAIGLFNGYYQVQKRRRGEAYLGLADIHNRQLKALTMSDMLIRSGEHLLYSLHALQHLTEHQNADLLRRNTTAKFNTFCHTCDTYNQFFSRLQHEISKSL